MAAGPRTRVLVIWSQANEATGEILRSALIEEGFDAPRLADDESWPLEAELSDVVREHDSVLILWDRNTRDSSRFLHLASIAYNEGRLVSAYKDSIDDVPAEFVARGAVNLTIWQGEQTSEAFKQLVEFLASGAGVWVAPESRFDTSALVQVHAKSASTLGAFVAPGWAAIGPWNTDVATIVEQDGTSWSMVVGLRRSDMTLLCPASPGGPSSHQSAPLSTPRPGPCVVLTGTPRNVTALQAAITSVPSGDHGMISVELAAPASKAGIGALVVQADRLVGLITDLEGPAHGAVSSSVIHEALGLVGVNDPDGIVGVILRRAAGLVPGKPMTPEALLVAALQWGLEVAGANEASTLVMTVPTDRAFRLTDAAQVLLSVTDRPDRAIGHDELHARSVDLSLKVSGSPARAELRHLLATALASGELEPLVLRRLGCSQADLLSALGRAITEAYPREGDWLSVLTVDDWVLRDPAPPAVAATTVPIDSPLLESAIPAPDSPEDSPGMEGDELPLNDLSAANRPSEADSHTPGPREPELPQHAVLRAGFDTDLVARRPDAPLLDGLGLEKQVELLANLLGSAETPLPVSVGVFGEWGTGKTYFLTLLHEALDRLTAAERNLKAQRPARENRQPERCAEIRQVWFNAWHYADANLWASLAGHLFEQLATPSDERADAATLRREVLRGHLPLLRAEEERLAAEVKQAERDAAAAETALQEARSKVVELEAVDVISAARDLVRASPEVEEARARLAVALSAAGLDPELADDPAQVIRKGAEQWRTIKSTWHVLAAHFALTVSVAIVSALVAWGLSNVLDGVAAAVGAVAGILVPLVSVLTMARRPLLKVLRYANDANTALIARQAAREEAEKAALARQLDEARTRVDDLQRRHCEAEARLIDAEAELESLGTAEQLIRFIGERSASDDYRGQLGIVSLVRRDFEELSRLLLAHRMDSEDPNSSIERIVLYIDDLDRCAPKRVVEVLEAVHLLLALDLFAVVVAVDPRWLLRSLELQRLPLERNAIESAVGPTEQEDTVWFRGWASPLDYLEKIFQIPFVLPLMDAGGLATVLASLRRPTEASNPVSDERPPPPLMPNPAEDPTSGRVTRPADTDGQGQAFGPEAELSGSGLLREVQTPDSDSQPSDLEPIRLDLSDQEIRCISEFAPLLRTPRTGKRVANVYRLLRSAETPAVLLGRDGAPGQHQVVIELLAVVTAHPELFGALRRAIVAADARDPSTPWARFVETLEPKIDDDGLVRNAVGTLGRSADAWRDVYRNLSSTALARRTSSWTVRDYTPWAAKVARFSFLPELESDLPL